MANLPGNGAHLLLVEDDGDLREVLAIALTIKGYSVRCAKNGSQALAMMHAPGGRPRLLITDLQMPGSDGWALRRDMLADDELATVPVVVMSAAIPRDDKDALVASAYLEKPVSLVSLLQSIEAHME